MASLLPQQIDLLERLVEASRRAEKREPFMAVRTFDGDSLQHPGLDSTEVYFSDLEVLADRGLLHVGHVGQHEMTFDVSPEGFEFVVDQDASGQVAAFFHVEAELAETGKWDYEMDLTVDQAMGVWARYESGQRFSVNGRMLAQSDVSRLRIVATRQTSEQLRSLVAEEHERIKLTDMQHPWQWHIMERGQSVTRQFSEARRAEEDAAPGGADQAADRRVVFVVHGRNDGARKAMFEFLRSIDLRPLEWSQAVKATGEAAPYVGQVLVS